MGLIYATLGEHEAAVEQFLAATRLDQYLAVASVVFPSSPPNAFFFLILNSSYFQCGVSNFLIGRFDLSAKDFDEALLYLRGNQSMYVAYPDVPVLFRICACLVTIPKLALPSHYIPQRSFLTKVSIILTLISHHLTFLC